MKLTDNFFLKEFEKSNRAKIHGINNAAKGAEIENIKALCENIMQPVRTHFEKPVKITSGFRCLELNRAVNGAETSQHCTGQACDFVISHDHKEVAEFIRDNLDFDQLILENYYSSQFSKWIHVSYSLDKNKNRKEVLNLKNGKYIKGLEDAK